MQPAAENHVDSQPSVVLALFALGHPTPALLQAEAFARALRADLHVLRVLPEHTRPNPIFHPSGVAEAVSAIEDTLSAQRLTHAWLADTLGDRTAMFRSTIAHGDFLQQTSIFASKLGATLIVVPSGTDRLGQLVTTLADTSGVSVLVSRSSNGAHLILAATNLRHHDFPVLRKAAEVGQILDAPVLALHNMTPMSGVAAGGATWLSPIQPDPMTRWKLLAQAFEQVPLEADATIRTESSAVHAILDEVRIHDADLVVVGTRHKHWFERMLTRNVAARIVDRCTRSVLVTPITNPDLRN